MEKDLQDGCGVDPGRLWATGEHPLYEYRVITTVDEHQLRAAGVRHGARYLTVYGASGEDLLDVPHDQVRAVVRGRRVVESRPDAVAPATIDGLLSTVLELLRRGAHPTDQILHIARATDPVSIQVHLDREPAAARTSDLGGRPRRPLMH